MGNFALIPTLLVIETTITVGLNLLPTSFWITRTGLYNSEEQTLYTWEFALFLLYAFLIWPVLISTPSRITLTQHGAKIMLNLKIKDTIIATMINDKLSKISCENTYVPCLLKAFPGYQADKKWILKQQILKMY